MFSYDRKILVNAAIMFCFGMLCAILNETILPENQHTNILNAQQLQLYYILAFGLIIGFGGAIYFVGHYIGMMKERKYFNGLGVERQ